MTTPQRARAWCFTLNNYTSLHETLLKQLDYRYLVYGREVGESGTPHLQGYIFFPQRKTLQVVRRLIQGAHVAPRGGTHKQASEYCKKDGDYFEDGDPPTDLEDQQKAGAKANAVKWKSINDHAKQGDLIYIQTTYPKEYILLKSKLESLYEPPTSIIDGELLHEWWVGTTGTGKSRLLWELYPDHFHKKINKWWDGYQYQEVVAIEEWSPDNAITAASLKIWADRYPFPGEIKGSTLQRLRPKKIIVLSNYTIQECFPRTSDFEPLARRFTVIKFPESCEHAKYRAAWFNNHPIAPSTSVTSSQSTDIYPDLDLGFLLDDL